MEQSSVDSSCEMTERLEHGDIKLEIGHKAPTERGRCCELFFFPYHGFLHRRYGLV